MRRAALLASLACAGCSVIAQPLHVGPGPASDAPIPTREVPTRDGQRLLAKDGALFVKPARGDVGAHLGVIVDDDARAVACLREGTGLQPGDRIVIAAWSVGPEALHRDRPLHEVLARGRPVHALADLEGYAAGAGWMHLDLVVVRGAGTVATCAEVQAVQRPVPLVAWSSRASRAAGVELCRLDDWAWSDVPEHAQPDELLVTRVEQGSPAAFGGLRPLDAVAIASVDSLLNGSGVVVRRPGGERWIAFDPAPDPPSDVHVPFVVSRADNGATAGFTLFWPLFTLQDERGYDHATDGTRESTTFTVLSLVSVDRTSTPRGASTIVTTFPMDLNFFTRHRSSD